MATNSPLGKQTVNQVGKQSVASIPLASVGLEQMTSPSKSSHTPLANAQPPLQHHWGHGTGESQNVPLGQHFALAKEQFKDLLSHCSHWRFVPCCWGLEPGACSCPLRHACAWPCTKHRTHAYPSQTCSGVDRQSNEGMGARETH